MANLPPIEKLVKRIVYMYYNYFEKLFFGFLTTLYTLANSERPKAKLHAPAT